MHELGIAQGILEIVEQHVPEETRPRVRHVIVQVGDLAGVVADSLEFCFEAIVRSTALEAARLRIERIPVRAECRACGRGFGVEGLAFLCPSCGGGDVHCIAGRELKVKEIEIADEADAEACGG